MWPDEVSRNSVLECPSCGKSMHVRSGHTTENGILKPRCFAHNPNHNGGCSGGESDTHRKMKYIVSRRLQRMFDDVSVERETQVGETDRIGDVVVTFDGSIERFGQGVVAEVQYRHEEKDIQQVTEDYVQSGYSVYWFGTSDFDDDFETVDVPDLITPWPRGVPEMDCWTGVEKPVQGLKQFGARHSLTAKFPRELIEKNRDWLKQWWMVGRSDFDFDLVYTVGENNSSRSCESCGESADLYFLQDGVISTFRCENHLPDASDEREDANRVD